jgi:hypothetical protein
MAEQKINGDRNIVRSEDYLKGLSAGFQESAMMLMKLKKAIEIEMKETK